MVPGSMEREKGSISLAGILGIQQVKEGKNKWHFLLAIQSILTNIFIQHRNRG
jgi:hypothetical protein